MRVGVSQRHLSFVESGRSRPSRALLVAWLQALDVSLPVRNQALLHAGFAPVYGHTPMNDPGLSQASVALRQLLQAHDPLPAFVIDADWNLVDINRGGQWLAGMLVPELLALPRQGPINLLDLLAHPDGFTRSMTNLEMVAPALVAHLRSQETAAPALNARLQAAIDQIARRAGAPDIANERIQRVEPVLTTRYQTPHGELAFFSLFTTFGTPQDITLASLRVEHLCPADEFTRAVLCHEVSLPPQ
jgi:transcriptional regulator with XRE-family HTH domain